MATDKIKGWDTKMIPVQKGRRRNLDGISHKDSTNGKDDLREIGAEPRERCTLGG